MSGQIKEQQRDASKYFNSTKRKEFQINNSVLVKKKKQAFYKHSNIFFPHYEKDVYKITHIDKKCLPWTYTVTNETTNKIRYLYAFEMRKMGAPANRELSKEPLTIGNSRILVHDVVLKQKSTLRSGRQIPNKHIVFYRITIDDRQDIVSTSALRLLIHSLGNTAVKYGPFFEIPENKKYCID